MLNEQQPDEQQPRRPVINIAAPLIVLACGGGGMLLGLGLCGAATAIPGARLTFLNVPGIAFLALSVVALFGGFFWLIAAFIMNASRS